MQVLLRYRDRISHFVETITANNVAPIFEIDVENKGLESMIIVRIHTVCGWASFKTQTFEF
jgi:hypothetical protein